MEVIRLLPVRITVALRTLRAEGALVWILVADSTVARDEIVKDKLSRPFRWFRLQDRFGGDVTFLTLHVHVFAAQLEIRFIMLEWATLLEV